MDNAKLLRRPATRRLIQLYSALLHNAYIRGFVTGRIYQGNAKYACVPGLNCYSCPGAAGSCPLGALQNTLASAGHRAGWYVLGILLLFGVILGRTICGWLCPMGLVQELLHRIPSPKIRKSRLTRILSFLKYIILALFVIALPLWYGLAHDLPVPAFCKYICPAGTLEGAAGNLAHPANASLYGMLGPLFTGKWVILLVILLACVFCYRSFCRFICPLGAIYSLFSRFALIGIQTDTERCNGCGECVRSCGMDVMHAGDRECIQCGQCMDSCIRGAISIRAGRIILKGPDTVSTDNPHGVPKRYGKKKQLLQGAAILLMCFALVWFNLLDPSVRKGSDPGYTAVSHQSSAFHETPAGHAEGEQLPDFVLTCYDGTEFRLSDCRGRVTIINLWATYCGPCKTELPYFSELYAQHRDELAMIAIHPSLITDDPQQYLSDKNYLMPFATDTDDTAAEATGYTGTLPQTVVLDRNGIVIYNAAGSVTPELLGDLYEKAGSVP
ncbi:MAG: redoxin domain-containing protein [Clostridia bacterium]|nr:redoxin domain-containing protein [Clostridia bacterium]